MIYSIILHFILETYLYIVYRKDIQVELKKDYNTKRYNNGEPVLDGGGWYRTQAYRGNRKSLPPLIIISNYN